MRRIGHDMPDDASTRKLPQPLHRPRSRPIGDLFAPTFVRDTLALCASFFFCLMVNYVAIQLVPSMLLRQDVGFTQPRQPVGLQRCRTIGGVIGAVARALVIQRVGSRMTMLGMSAARDCLPRWSGGHSNRSE